MTIQNLANQQISASFRGLMQISSSGRLYDGTGSLVTSVTVNSFTGSFTGSLFGTASFATTTSNVNPLNQNVQITGSLTNGIDLTATGNYSHAQGLSTTSSGTYSHAEGQGSRSIGSYSHAEGRNTTTVGTYSHAEGLTTVTSGSYSHAEGLSSVASGAYSHAEGSSTLAIGSYSHTEGISTVANGDLSHAEGSNTTAIGEGSHTEGLSTIALGNYSHAEGRSSITSGAYSHAEGWGTTAVADYQHVQGTYNRTSTEPGAFILGNGISNANRSNLIFASGTRVQITGSVEATQGVTGSLFGTSSWSTNAQTASFVNTLNQNLTLNGNLTLSGTASISFLSVTFESASIIFSSGSNQFGDATNDRQTLIGTVIVSGSQQVTGSLTVTQGITGSLFGTSSWATRAATASFVTPLNQNVIITGSLSNGFNILSIGVQSHAQGFETQASGSYSHAEGAYTQTTGSGAHAEGINTRANGDYSHAEGNGAQAIGFASHAEGFDTRANGDYSHAEGIGTITSASYQHAQGMYNITSSVQSAFILGNGTSNTNRSNLIFAAGNQVQITGSLNVSGSITGSLQGPSTLIPIASSSISAGSIFFDTVENKLYVYNGASWKTASLG